MSILDSSNRYYDPDVLDNSRKTVCIVSWILAYLLLAYVCQTFEAR